MVAVDLGGRPYLQYRTTFRKGCDSGFDFDLLEDFFQAFSTGLMANIAIVASSARSNHHQAEAIFQSLRPGTADGLFRYLERRNYTQS